MSAERTLAIVKPDAFGDGNAGRILAQLEAEGFRLLAGRVIRLTRDQARAFYAVHAERPFFPSLVEFMTSGPCLAVALEREGAVAHLRRVVGATDPAEAAPETIRARYAESKQRNAIHASDSAETARQEISFFFSGLDLEA
ncbi:MAG: nucleoside-diphosphate kinase [Gemmatimonadota bacterium]